MASVSDDDLLDAARRAFGAHGFADTTMERIADEAGVSRVTLHRRGITKDALLSRLADAATADYRQRLWPALTAAGTAAERLQTALHALCSTAEEHQALLLALRSKADLLFHDGADQALTRTVFTEPFERLLRDGQADGSLRVDDPVESATVLFNLVGWTYIHLRQAHGWPPERAERATLNPVLHGLLVHDPSAAAPTIGKTPEP